MRLPVLGTIVVYVALSFSNADAQTASSDSVLQSGAPHAPIASRLAPLPFRPGTPIRVYAGSALIKGTLVTSSRDTVFVRHDSSRTVLAVTTSAISGIDIQFDPDERRARVLRGVGIGSGVGMLAGTLVGAAIPVEPDCPEGECWDFSGLDGLANTVGGALVGGALGAIIGGAMGSAASSGWQPYKLHRIAVAPAGRLRKPTGVAVAVRLPLP